MSPRPVDWRPEPNGLPVDASPVRLAHVLDSLALAIELGLGVPSQTIHRTAVISARLGSGAGLDEDDVVAAYYLAMLCYVGCTTTSHATSKAVDELGLGPLLVATDDEFVPELERALAATMPTADARAAAQSRWRSGSPARRWGHTTATTARQRS